MPKVKPLVGEKTDKTTQHGRDVYQTKEGDNVSELSVTFQIGDKWYNAPSIYDGTQYEEEEVKRMVEDGKVKPSSVHNSLEDALDAAAGRTDEIKYAKGGDMMDRQMNLFAEGGMMDDSGEVVNGVEVPPGSLKEEVADDVPARLSEGEFVIPADVVRYIGLEKLMAMRDKAKAGLDRMQEMGQVGNADEVDNPDQLFSDSMPQEEEDLSGFESEIDDILAEDQQFASGGVVRKYAPGGDVSLAPKSYKAAPISGFAMTKYANEQGDIKYIPTVGGKPLLPVPQGYSVDNVPVVEEPVDTSKKDVGVTAPPSEGGGGGGGGGGDGDQSSGGGDSGGLPGQGISISGQNLAFNALAIAENKGMKAAFPIATTVASYIANSYLDDQLDKSTEAAEAVSNNDVTKSGMFTMAMQDGSIATVSNTASVQAQDIAVFGGYFNANGDFVEVNSVDVDSGGRTGEETADPGIATDSIYGVRTGAETADPGMPSGGGYDAEGGVADGVDFGGGDGGYGSGTAGYDAGDMGHGGGDSGSSGDGGGYSSSSDGGWGDSDTGEYAKGGLVKRKYPAKKKSKKTGLASR